MPRTWRDSQKLQNKKENFFCLTDFPKIDKKNGWKP